VFLIFIINVSPLEKQLSYADYLFEEGDYFRAITEYKRFIFLSPNPEEKLFAKKRILSSYKKACRYEEAMDYLETFQSEGLKNLEKGKLNILMGNAARARTFFESNDSDTAKILKGWTYFEEANWEKAGEEFLIISDNSALSTIAENLSAYAEKADTEIEERNVLLSALFSSIIPGSGRFYAGRPGDGFFSFLTVAIPSLISYVYWKKNRKKASSIAISFAAIFYVGDIYGSIVAIEEFNKVKEKEYLEKIENNLHIQERFIKQ